MRAARHPIWVAHLPKFAASRLRSPLTVEQEQVGDGRAASYMRNPNEWNLLREEFDTLVHTEGVRRDELEQILDHQMRLRFGELIAWAAGHKSKDYHGPWPPGP